MSQLRELLEQRWHQPGVANASRPIKWRIRDGVLRMRMRGGPKPIVTMVQSCALRFLADRPNGFATAEEIGTHLAPGLKRRARWRLGGKVAQKMLVRHGKYLVNRGSHAGEGGMVRGYYISPEGREIAKATVF